MEVVLLKIKNRFFQKINYKICAIFVFVFCCFIFSGNTAHAANRFWVGGTGNWSDATNHWASVSNGAPGAGNLPTASDNVFFDSFSGAGITTVDASVFTDDLDFTGYTGNFAGSQPLTISGSLTLGAGMTRTYTGIITFNATSSKTITSNNIILSSSINFNGAGGSWVFQDALNNNAGSILFNNGTLNTNGKTVSVGFFTSNTSNTRTLNMASSDIRIGGGGSSAWSFNITGLTFIAPAILRFNNTTSINLTTNFTYNDVIFNNIGFPGAQPIISGSNTFTNLTMNSWFGSNIASIYLSANQTITGTLTISGNSPVSRILVQSNTIGTPRTLTVGAVSLSNVDFMDIIGAGGASPFAGTSIGNSLGNTNITTTTPVTRYWVGNGGNWSSIAHWSATSGGVSGASVPLSQDSVIFDANSITLSSQTIITDMPRLSADLNFTGVLNNPALSFTSTDNTMYGSLTLSSGMTLTGNNSLIFSPRSSVNLTSAGRDFGSVQIYINAPGGSLTLQDNLVSLYIFHLDFGVFDVNNKNIRSFAFSSNTSNSRVLNMGSGVWTIYGSSGAVWNVSGSGITLNANTSTIKFSESSGTVNSKSFVGGGLTYNNIWFSNPTSGSSIGTWVVNGSNIFNDFKDDNTSAHTVNFTAGTTQTVNTFTVAGSAGNLITLNSSVNGSAWNLSKFLGASLRS